MLVAYLMLFYLLSFIWQLLWMNRLSWASSLDRYTLRQKMAVNVITVRFIKIIVNQTDLNWRQWSFHLWISSTRWKTIFIRLRIHKKHIWQRSKTCSTMVFYNSKMNWMPSPYFKQYKSSKLVLRCYIASSQLMRHIMKLKIYTSTTKQSSTLKKKTTITNNRRAIYWSF